MYILYYIYLTRKLGTSTMSCVSVLIHQKFLVPILCNTLEADTSYLYFPERSDYESGTCAGNSCFLVARERPWFPNLICRH